MIMLKTYTLIGDVEPELNWLKAIGPCRGMAVDIGANQGFYSLALTRLYTKVLSFEPNKKVAATLIAAALPRVKVIHVGLSSKEGEATFYIPSFQGMSLPGWASVDEHNCPGATEIEELKIHLRTLDSYYLKEVGFIKIDVEGHECEVLRGAVETIQRERPHLLVEVRDHHLSEIRTLLSGFGYYETTLQALGGPKGAQGNHLFVPVTQA